jgi:hypothetical protein
VVAEPRQGGGTVKRALAMLLLMTGCGTSAPQIAFDLDECRFCRMIISDERFAAAATTSGGRTVRFDSIECLAGWAVAEDEPPRALWVTNRQQPRTLIPVAQARFAKVTGEHTPMHGGWQGFAAAGAPSEAIGWDSLVVLVGQEAVP